MCGFVGFSNFKKDISNMKQTLLDMNSSLYRRGPDEDGYYIDKKPRRWQATYDRKIFLW